MRKPVPLRGSTDAARPGACKTGVRECAEREHFFTPFEEVSKAPPLRAVRHDLERQPTTVSHLVGPGTWFGFLDTGRV